MHVVIIGNGIGGNACATKIRQYDKEANITMVSAETCPSYDPCSLPYFVGEAVPRDEVFLKPAETYEEEGVTLLLGHKVTKIDTEAKKVYFYEKNGLCYDKLVIAVGGSMIILPFKGVNLKGVHYCKTLNDADNLAKHQGTAAVVIGTGLIGIEAGEALKKKGYEVTLIEVADWIMPKSYDKESADQLADALRSNGINVLCGEKVMQINGETAVQSVTTDKREIKCDTVVMATGVRPSTEFVAEAGIELAPNKGVIVDDHMRTSAPDVYACGDCAQTKDAFTGEDALNMLRNNAIEQAEVIAKNLVGIDTSYRGAWNFTRAHFFHSHAVSLGKTETSVAGNEGVEIIEKKFNDDYAKLILLDGKLVGAQLIGKETLKAGILLGVMWRKDDLGFIRDNWEKVSAFNTSYPWNYRFIGKYMKL